MRELALHLLDIAENSVAAKASNISITVIEDTAADSLSMRIRDDGKGMDAQQAARAVDPFVTSRTTRKVGLGLPLLKSAAEACNGGLSIQSAPGKGTQVDVMFQRSHIDRMPLGDLATTIHSLVVAFPNIHWTFHYRFDDRTFDFDDAVYKKELGDVPLTEPAVLAFFRDVLTEGVKSVQPTRRETTRSS